MIDPVSAPPTPGPPDVAMVMPDFSGGGAERMMVRLASAFSELGRRAESVVCTATGPFLQECDPRVAVVDLERRGALAALPAIIRYLRRRRPRVLLVTLDHMTVIAIWARMLSGVNVRLVVRQASNPAGYRGLGPRDRIVVSALRQWLPRADAIVTGSHGVASDLAAWSRVPPHRIHVVGNPIVDASLAALAEEHVEHPFLTTAGPPVVLAAGRLTAAKDFMTLLRAFDRAQRSTPLRLIILGEGPDRMSLETYVRDHAMAAVVSLPGFVANPFAYMSRADVFVLSSVWEGLPGVLVQAMACGCPVVSTDCRSGPREILNDGSLGPLVAVGDADALGDAIVRTLEAPTSANALRQRAAEFSVERSVAGYAAVLWPRSDDEELPR